MSCGCRTGLPQNDNLHKSKWILIFFYCFSWHVHMSNEIFLVLWLSGSKWDQHLNISLLLSSEVDDSMTFLILHCSYYYYLNDDLIVQIHNLMRLLIFRWVYHNHLMFWHLTFIIFSYWIFQYLEEPSETAQDPQWSSSDTPRTP